MKMMISCLQIIILLISLAEFASKHSFVSNKVKQQQHLYIQNDGSKTKKTSIRKLTIASSIDRLRGGALETNGDESLSEKFVKTSAVTSVLVTTSIGSVFLDKKKKVIIPSNCTVGELKNILKQKFPGGPPVELQNLYFGSQHLSNDSAVVSSLSTLSPLPLLLDMITGTGSYNKTLSVTQALDAYVSTIVQQAYLGEKLKHETTQSPPHTSSHTAPHTNNEDDPKTETENEEYEEVSEAMMETPLYRQMYETINASIYSTYADSIAEALEVERDPEEAAEDTKAWRSSGRDKAVNPLTARLATEFDLNKRGLQSFAYYSAVMTVSAQLQLTCPLTLCKYLHFT